MSKTHTHTQAHHMYSIIVSEVAKRVPYLQFELNIYGVSGASVRGGYCL